jgi:hypothetical protein
MTTVTRIFRRSLAGFATSALVWHAAVNAAPPPIAHPLAVQPLGAKINRSPPSVASVMEASANAAPLIPSAPIVVSQLATFQPLVTNFACYPATTTYDPYGLLPQGGFSSSPTTPFPQASWPINPNHNEVINYVIQRAVLNTTSWTTVATTCSGPPSIWMGSSPSASHDFKKDTYYFDDMSGGLLPGTTYVYKVIAVDQNNRTDWASFQWTSQQVLPTVQVTNYQNTKSTITFTASQFYNLAGQMVDPAWRLRVQPNNGPAFLVRNTCGLGMYGLVCQVKMDAKNQPNDVSLTFEWGVPYTDGSDGFHVLVQSGIKMRTP